MLAADNFFNIFQPLLVVGQNGVAHDLVFLQLVDHIAIIGDFVSFFLGHLRGYRLHLRLYFRKGLMRHCCQLCGRNIYAIVFQIESVLFGRQAKIFAGARHDLFANKTLIIGELLFQFGVSLFVAGNFVFFKKLADAIDKEFCMGQIVLDLQLSRSHQARLIQALTDAILGQLRNRCIAGFHACVFF